MRSPAPRGRRRTIGFGALLVLTVLVVLASPHLGRAEPDHNYRPDLPPAALTTGCYPLPGGVVLDLPHQVRWDGDVEVEGGGMRRELRGQYDLVDRDEALDRLTASFARAGFVTADEPEDDGWALLRRDDEVVRLRVREIADTSAATLVRGEFELDLPVAARASTAAVCGQRPSTKRWGPMGGWWESWVPRRTSGGQR